MQKLDKMPGNNLKKKKEKKKSGKVSFPSKTLQFALCLMFKNSTNVSIQLLARISIVPIPRASEIPLKDQRP